MQAGNGFAKCGGDAIAVTDRKPTNPSLGRETKQIRRPFRGEARSGQDRAPSRRACGDRAAPGGCRRIACSRAAAAAGPASGGARAARPGDGFRRGLRPDRQRRRREAGALRALQDRPSGGRRHCGRRRWPGAAWQRADAVFTGDTDEDGMGRWRFPAPALGETWPMQLLDVDFHGRFTAFRHVGVFPEQIAHWAWMRSRSQRRTAAQGAEPVRLYRRRLAGGGGRRRRGHPCRRLEEGDRLGAREPGAGRAGKAPIRWICDDAMKFILREERRGNRYDIILTDPPKFGRGPNWRGLAAVRPPAAHARRLPRTAVAGGDRPRADRLFDPRQLLFDPRTDARNHARRRRNGRIRRADHPRDGRSGETAGRALSTSLFSRWVPA